MSGLNQNDQSKKCQRFMDLGDEPLTMMTPIQGYEKMPLVSLEQAVKPLIKDIPKVEQMAYIAKQRAAKPPPDRLTEDQSAAIMLYTMEWEPRDESVYYRLNKALRTEDRQTLKPWFSYLKLLVTALSLLPSNPRTIFRGVKSDQKHRYKKGDKVIWWGFSSCTSTMDVLNNDAFLGSSGKRTMFTIECQNGKDIKQHSYFQRENEILLPAAREFQVESVLPQGGGLSLIQLKEVQPKYPLLESFDNGNKIVQEFPSSQSHASEATSHYRSEPVYKQPIQTPQNRPIIYSNQYQNKSCSSRLRKVLFFVFCCPCAACYYGCGKSSPSVVPA